MLPACSAPLLQPLSTDPSAQGRCLVPTDIPQLLLLRKEIFIDFSTNLNGSLCACFAHCTQHHLSVKAVKRLGAQRPGPRLPAVVQLCEPHLCRPPLSISVARSCPRERRETHAAVGTPSGGTGHVRLRPTRPGSASGAPWAQEAPHLSWVLASRPRSLHIEGGEGRCVCSALSSGDLI